MGDGVPLTHVQLFKCQVATAESLVVSVIVSVQEPADIWECRVTKHGGGGRPRCGVEGWGGGERAETELVGVGSQTDDAG